MIRLILILASLNYFNFAVAEQPSDSTITKYVVVGVSGFRTKKDSINQENIFSSEIASNGEKSGVWSYLPNSHSNILSSVYLTHFSSEKEIDQTIDLFMNNNSCDQSIGLIIMANSWGASVANKLASRYQQICNRMTDLFIMIDGINKPFIAPYSQSIHANICLNYYQNESFIHGDLINNCQNNLIQTRKSNSLMKAHISVEWIASRMANEIVYKFINQNFPIP